jgi:hypothetical protein
MSTDDFTPGEMAHIERYAVALKQLAEENVHYKRNYYFFKKWDNAMRLWWIDRIEQDARDGKETVAKVFVLRVTMNRLDEGQENDPT